MNIDVIKKEISSQALVEIVESLFESLERLKKNEIKHEQAGVEFAGHRHIITSIAIDWLYNRRVSLAHKLAKDK